MSDRPDLAPYRVRHNLKFRMLQVLRVQTTDPASDPRDIYR